MQTLIKAIIAILLTVSLSWAESTVVVVGQPAATVSTVTDNFNRSDGAIGSNWTTVSGRTALVISSTTAIGGTGSSLNASYYSGISFNENQYAQAKVNGTNNNMYVTVREQSGALTYYGVGPGSATYAFVRKTVSGTENVLDTIGGLTISSGDVWKISASGTSTVTLTVWQNGVQVWTGSDTSSTITGGAPGIAVWDNVVSADDFEAGNL